jgi:predicted dinucleotide-binding enzyme
MYGLEPLIPIALFFSVAAVVVLRGPLGRAIGERIAGRADEVTAGSAREAEALRAEVEQLHDRLTDLEERVDFTERVLARSREQSELPPGH